MTFTELAHKIIFSRYPVEKKNTENKKINITVLEIFFAKNILFSRRNPLPHKNPLLK